MRALPLLALLATATALDGLPPCQSRCYDMAADLAGCAADDYACHCAAFDGRLAPQMSSCMIEGCAFGDEGPTMAKEDLKGKVCGMAGQSSAPDGPSEETGGATTATPSTSDGSQDPGETASEGTSKGPDETAEPGPRPTEDDGEGDDGGDGESGAAGLSVWLAALVPVLGYLFL